MAKEKAKEREKRSKREERKVKRKQSRVSVLETHFKPARAYARRRPPCTCTYDEAGAAAYLENGVGTTFPLVVDEVVPKQLFKAHTAELLPADDYKLVVKIGMGRHLNCGGDFGAERRCFGELSKKQDDDMDNLKVWGQSPESFSFQKMKWQSRVEVQFRGCESTPCGTGLFSGI